MDRTTLANQWLAQQYPEAAELQPASADASFRRYFRFANHGQNLILMDAPPQTENNVAFVKINQALAKLGVPVPQIFAFDVNQGLLVLSDLGNILLAHLPVSERTLRYQQALSLLPLVSKLPEHIELPLYDRAFILRELQIFNEWLWQPLMQSDLNTHQAWQQSGNWLAQTIDQLPKVGMHRDFHSRNIMVQGSVLAVIDYQDAVQGPQVYDVVSLLKDCYVALPDEEYQALLAFAWQLHRGQRPADGTFADYCRDVDLVGLQRHLKAAGIFMRLNLRDGKANYLPALPLTWQYIMDVVPRYPETATLLPLLQQLQQKMVEHGLL